MSHLDRYILRQVLGTTLLGLGVVAFVAVAYEVAGRMREMPAELVRLGDVGRLSLLFLPSLAVIVIPITLLLGVLMTFGRLAEQGELIAIKAAGVPLKRVVAPVIALGAVLSGLSFVIQDRVQPWAIARAFDIIYRELPQRATIEMLSPGVMHQYADWRIYFARKDPATLMLYDIDLVIPDEGGEASVFHAKSAQLIRSPGRYEIELRGASWIRGEGPLIRSEVFRLGAPMPSAGKVRGSREALNLAELFESERNLTSEYEATHSEFAKSELWKDRREIGDRLSLPFAALAVAIVGAPLGARARRAGRSYTFAAGFGIILVYYVLKVVMDQNGLRTMSTVLVNTSIPNAALILAGLALLWRVDRV